ncbi:MAG: hypothetical protein M2R46_00745 [Verrucomicrobia subdivision 3 bacterium]|nr:hypothetical protein [Limisphaerales bacterium]
MSGVGTLTDSWTCLGISVPSPRLRLENFIRSPCVWMTVWLSREVICKGVALFGIVESRFENFEHVRQVLAYRTVTATLLENDTVL